MQGPTIGEALRAVGGSIEKIEEARTDVLPCCELAHADGVAAGQRFEREVILAELALDIQQYVGPHRQYSNAYAALKRARDRIAARAEPEAAP